MEHIIQVYTNSLNSLPNHMDLLPFCVNSGAPIREQMTLSPEDIIHVQASVKGGLLLPSIPPHILFAAVQDDGPPQTDLEPSGFLM